MSGLAFTDSVISSLAWPLAVVTVVILLRGRLQDLLDRVEDVEGWGFKAKVGQRAKTLKAEVKELVAEIEPEPPGSAETTEAAETNAGADETAAGEGTSTPSAVISESEHQRTPSEEQPTPGEPSQQTTAEFKASEASARLRTRMDRIQSRREWLAMIDHLIASTKELRQDGGERAHVTNSGLVIEAWANLGAALHLAATQLMRMDLEPGQFGLAMQAALGRDRELPPHVAANALARAGALTPEGLASINKLRRLRNEVAHAQRSISDQAADDYVEAVVGALELLKAGVAQQI